MAFNTILNGGNMTMRILPIILLMIYISTGCYGENAVTITKTIKTYRKADNGKTIPIEIIEKDTVPANTEQMILLFPIGKELHKVDGIENLKNLKRLIAGYYGYCDLSFISRLNNLEILIIDNVREPVDLGMIMKSPKLKILYLAGIEIIKEELNLQNNKELEYVYLSNIRSINRNGKYELSIKNVPESLKYVDLYLSEFIIINDKLLDSFKNVFCIVPKWEFFSIENSLQTSPLYLPFHPNVHVYEGKELLPEKYQKKQIYALFGLDEDGKYISTGKYPNTSDDDFQPTGASEGD